MFACIRVDELAMKPTGKEFLGKLSLARAEQLALTVQRYRQAQVLGIKVKLEVLATPGCLASEAQAGRTYTLDEIPALPIPGCTNSHGCGCRYSPVT
jgi:hypothetical protein